MGGVREKDQVPPTTASGVLRFVLHRDREEIVYKQGMEHGGPLKRLGAETADGRTGGPAQFHLSNRCLPGMPHPMCVDSVYRWQVSINLGESSLVICTYIYNSILNRTQEKQKEQKKNGKYIVCWSAN